MKKTWSQINDLKLLTFVIDGLNSSRSIEDSIKLFADSDKRDIKNVKERWEKVVKTKYSNTISKFTKIEVNEIKEVEKKDEITIDKVIAFFQKNKKLFENPNYVKSLEEENRILKEKVEDLLIELDSTKDKYFDLLDNVRELKRIFDEKV